MSHWNSRAPQYQSEFLQEAPNAFAEMIEMSCRAHREDLAATKAVRDKLRKELATAVKVLEDEVMPREQKLRKATEQMKSRYSEATGEFSTKVKTVHDEIGGKRDPVSADHLTEIGNEITNIQHMLYVQERGISQHWAPSTPSYSPSRMGSPASSSPTTFRQKWSNVPR